MAENMGTQMVDLLPIFLVVAVSPKKHNAHLHYIGLA